MTNERFTIEILDDENWLIEDNETGLDYNPIDGTTRVLKGLIDLVNNLYDENEQLKKELLFFYDVANCECSTNWRKDMEKGCKRFFNCTYEEAKEKYGDYDGMWWEIND